MRAVWGDFGAIVRPNNQVIRSTYGPNVPRTRNRQHVYFYKALVQQEQGSRSFGMILRGGMIGSTWSKYNIFQHSSAETWARLGTGTRRLACTTTKETVKQNHVQS